MELCKLVAYVYLPSFVKKAHIAHYLKTTAAGFANYSSKICVDAHVSLIDYQ